MRRLKFLWGYLTNSAFRHWVDLNAEQEMLNEIENIRRDQMEYAARKMYLDLGYTDEEYENAQELLRAYPPKLFTPTIKQK